jgi:uncharacterized protein (DUF342 family)
MPVQIRVELRKAGLEAIAALTEGPFEGEPAVASALEQLGTLGVQPVPQTEQVQAALAPLGGAEVPANGVVIARGVLPQQGVGAQVLPLFPVRSTPLEEGEDPLVRYARNVVYPGDRLLERTPPSPGIPGRSLLGAEVPAPAGKDIQVLACHGVQAGEDERTFTSETYGVALFHNQRLQVVDALRVADDFMSATLTVLPDGRLDEDGQLAKLVAALRAMGVTRGVKNEVLLAAVRKARAEGQPVPGVLVAQGRPPRDGREIDYELLVDAQQKVGKELEGGRIDFREAESVKNVTRGEPLARIVPAIEPEQGYRVDGEMLRPKMVRAQGLKPGQNTALSEDGTQIVADGDGMLVVQGGKFHLADQYLVNGDVNYTTGNIRATGSVTIRGQVKPGFEVEAGKEVEIHGDVEEARVTTASNLTVRGGITANSVVTAGQNICARYIQSSTVETQGNLDVKLSVTNSKVYVRGQMTVTGSQGAVIGGEVNAALGIEARDIGSPAAKTHVAVGVDLRVLRELEEIAKEREGNQQTLGHLQGSLGKAFLQDPRGTLAAIPAALRKPKIEMLQKMQDIFKREKELAARDAELQQLNAEIRIAQITVQGEIHAGTVITISQLRHVLKENLRRVVLYYDPDQNQVAWRRL